jgi:hypothetical protein
MAHIYVDSAAAGAGTGADWANAYTTLEAAAEAAGTAAGDSIWVAHSHAETRASAMSITFKNTTAAPGTVMCVNKAGSVPPVAADLSTTATITTTGANDITLTGVAYIYGIIFSAGTGAVASGIQVGYLEGLQYFKNCAIKRAGTVTGTITVGYPTNNQPQRIIFDNTTVEFGNVSDALDFGGTDFLWKNTSAPIGGAIFPTILLRSTVGSSIVSVRGVDFSALGTGKTLVGSFLGFGTVLLKNCKTHVDVTLSTTPTSSAKFSPTFINCDSGDTNYRTEKYSYEGTLTTETTVVLSGGAGDGTTPISWKVVTTANSHLTSPFECLPTTIWNDTTGARTVTVQGIWSTGALPNNDQIWMDVEYLGNSGSTQSTTATTGLANLLATPVALTAGDGTWGGSTTKFKMTSAITAAEKGPITVRIYAAEPLSTIYIDPKITLS